MPSVEFLETFRGVTQTIRLPVAPQGRWGIRCDERGCDDPWTVRQWHDPVTTYRHNDMYGCPNKHPASASGQVPGIIEDDLDLIDDPGPVRTRTWWHASDSLIATFDERPLHVGSREAADLRSIHHQFNGQTYLYKIKITPQIGVSAAIYVEREGGASLEERERLAAVTSPTAFRYVNVREAPGSISLLLLGMAGIAAPPPSHLPRLPRLESRSRPLYL